MGTLGHILGLDNASGPAYLFWSGIGANFGEFAIVVSLVSLIRKHNCHVHRCPRVGRHHIEGTSWVVCAKHHPDGAPTASQVADAGGTDVESR